MFQHSQGQEWQKLEVIADLKVRCGARGRGSHVRLIHAQNIHAFVGQCIAGIIQLRVHSALDSLVGQQCSNSNLISRQVHIRQTGGDRDSQRQHTNTALAYR